MIYKNENRKMISFPLGGIGSGCIGLAGNGQLIDWEIFNRPNKFSENRKSHFAVRCFQDGWSISLPKEIKVVDGNLRPCYTPILEKLRKRKTVSGLTKNMLTKKSSTVFWELGNGEIIEESGKISLKTYNHSFQSYMINTASIPGAEISYSFTLDNSEGGIRIEITDDNGGTHCYFAVASTIEKEFILYEEIFFNVLCKRKFDFENNIEYTARIFVYDGIIEIYINDILLIQNSFNTKESVRVGIFCGNGDCSFKDFCVYELRS